MIIKAKAITSKNQIEKENSVHKLKEKFETEFLENSSETYTAEPITCTLSETVTSIIFDDADERNVGQVKTFIKHIQMC